MKKIIIAVALLIVGCEKEEVKIDPIIDCGCNRIVNLTPYEMDIIIDDYRSKKVYGAAIFTVNDCSKEKKSFNYSSETTPFSMKQGSCYYR